MTSKALGVQRVSRRLLEAAVLVLALVSAYVYRFEFPLPTEQSEKLLLVVGPIVGVKLLALRMAGAHRHSWRYTSIDDVADVVLAMSMTSLVLVALRVAPATPDVMVLSLGVTMADWVASIAGLVGVRMARRLESEHRESRASDQRRRTGTRRVLLVGAGRAGVMVAKEIAGRPDLGLRPVGFVDDDRAKQDRRIAGLEVLGTTAEIDDIAEYTGADEVILTMASVGRDDIRRIVDACEAAGLPTKIIPGLFEIVGGHVNLSRIRPVSVEDLLGRDPVDLDPTSLHDLLGGKTVMVTGAGGSIGSELVRQAARFAPRRILLVERSEPSLWRIHREMVEAYPTLELRTCIADVCDGPRMRRLFDEHQPHVVVHAAAHKHVPMMEDHPGEAVKNNVGGTRTVADLAAEFEVEHFVLVSTDKAVNPTSVMGATKRLTERYVQHVAAKTGLNFVAVRFGNVLGSAGSVVPIFREQVQRGGPVTVTDPEMVRYFMTIPEASGLVLQAAALGQPGEILVLDMGEPVKIVDLARNVIRLSGFEPDVDIPIEFTGLRPGEKLFEELSLDAENATRTRHQKVWIGRTLEPMWDTAESDLTALLTAADAARPDDVRALLKWIVPEFTGSPDHRPDHETTEVAKH